MRYLYLLFLTLTYAFNASEEASGYLNKVYRDTVSGSDQDIYSLLDIYYEERQLVNGFVYKSVLLLNNTLSNSLSLHYLKSWTDFNNSKFELLEHTSPKFESIEEGEMGYITESMLTFLNINNLNFTAKHLNKQTVKVTPVIDISNPNQTAPEEVEITLFTAETLLNDKVYHSNLVLNSTGAKHAYVWQIATLETIAEKETMDRLKLKVTLLIAIILCFILASSLTYVFIYIYYRRKNTIPCVRNNEEKARLTFNMAA
jgi:hypothetical protein